MAIKNVTENDNLMIITRSGLTIRMDLSEIRVAGRATQGVKLITLREGDSIASVSVVSSVGTESADTAEETIENE